MGNRFLYFLRETLVGLRRNLLMTLAGIITIWVSLAILGAALLSSRMVDHGTERWKHGVELEIFMNVDATDNQIRAVQEGLAHSGDVRHFRYLSKADAYREAKRLFRDQPELWQSVGPDSLPSSFRVAPRRAEDTELVAGRFRSQPGVDQVKTAQQAVKNLIEVTGWVRRAFVFAFGLLLASALFLIVNTIRLATFARRREIEVMKLVGASNWFVRVPFMLEGLAQGVIGALLAFLAVAGLRTVLTDFVDRQQTLTQGFYLTQGDAVQIGIWVLLLGGAIGIVGSLLGLRRFLEV